MTTMHLKTYWSTRNMCVVVSVYKNYLETDCDAERDFYHEVLQTIS